MQKYGPYLSLLLAGIILYATRGHFHLPLVFFLPLPALFLFWGRIRPRQSSASPSGSLLLHQEVQVWLGLLFLFALFTACRPLLIYRQNMGLATAFGASFGIMALFFLFLLIRQWTLKTPGFPSLQLLPYLFIPPALCLSLIPTISPSPVIDVWDMGQFASDYLLQGQNPYTQSYPSRYDHYAFQYEHFFGYTPLVLLSYLPSKILTGDLRWTFILCHFLSTALLYWVGRATRLARPLPLLVAFAFFVFPVVPFVLEQAWIDPMTVFLLLLIVGLEIKNKSWAMSIVLGLLLAYKISNILVGPFLLPLFWRASKSKRRDILLMVGTAAVVTLPFYFWHPEAFMERVFWMLGQNSLTQGEALNFGIRMDALSWIALSHSLGIGLSSKISWILYFLLSGCFLFLNFRSTPPPRDPPDWGIWLSTTLWTFFMFSNWAFCNYFYFALCGIWISLIDGRLRKTPGESN